jgi:hypothetical protein
MTQRLLTVGTLKIKEDSTAALLAETKKTVSKKSLHPNTSAKKLREMEEAKMAALLAEQLVEVRHL